MDSPQSPHSPHSPQSPLSPMSLSQPSGTTAERGGELFVYNGDGIQSENILKYKSFGFHPVVLGDVLPKHDTCVSGQAYEPRYRILHKLGFGAFATVWLARDLVGQRFVALKVCRGTQAPVLSNEAKILRQLHDKGRGKPGYDHIVQLYDVFTIQGLNGFHECLVTELVIPLRHTHPAFSPQKTIKQLLIAIEFMHNEGVVHGDPHLGNLGIAIPRLHEIDDHDIENNIWPETIPVVPRDPSLPRDNIPPYIVSTTDFGAFIQEKEKCFSMGDELCLKVLDFGRASWIDHIPERLPGGCPVAVRPPEVWMHYLSNGRLGCTWSKEADIWAVGALAYRIKCDKDLVRREGNQQHQLYQALKHGGSPREEWLEFCDLEAFREETDYAEQQTMFDPQRVWASRSVVDKSEENIFHDLVPKMVKTEPDKRCQIAELLEHPFFLQPEEEVVLPSIEDEVVQPSAEDQVVQPEDRPEDQAVDQSESTNKRRKLMTD